MIILNFRMKVYYPKREHSYEICPMLSYHIEIEEDILPFHFDIFQSKSTR